MTTARDIIDRAAILLEDTGNVTYTRSELLGWVNEALGQVVLYAPGSLPRSVAVDLVAGTRQALPADTIVLIDVLRNLDKLNGDQPRQAVRIVTREALDNGPFDWHMARPQREVQVYCYDTNAPKEFFVYPPNDGDGRVELTYAAEPTPIAAEGDALPLQSIYDAAVLNYVMYRAYSHDTDYDGDGSGTAAAQFLQAFEHALNGKATLDSTIGANVALSQLAPNVSNTTK